MTVASSLLPLQLSGVGLTVNSTELLKDINLSVSDNGITAIMGHNGAGKSMLLKVLHGLSAPTEGHLTWGTEQLPTASVRHRQAMVFQKPILLRRSVAANIQYALDLPHATDTLSLHELLDLAGLRKLANRPAKALSGGEQQRLAFARALATGPDVLFLDEPAANLDPDATLALEKLIFDASQQSIKVFLVTHDIGQARRLAADVVFLRLGRIEEHSKASVFFNKPNSAYCQSFIDGVLISSYTDQ